MQFDLGPLQSGFYFYQPKNHDLYVKTLKNDVFSTMGKHATKLKYIK